MDQVDLFQVQIQEKNLKYAHKKINVFNYERDPGC